MHSFTTINPIAQAIAGFPIHTQIAIAVIQKDVVEYHGFIKSENGLVPINNVQSAFEIGSVTKSITGLVFCQLLVEKKVQLHDRIQDYLPFRLKNNPNITLRQLATHTAGLLRIPTNLHSQPDFDPTNPYKNYTIDHLATYCSQELQLNNPPGTVYEYTNLGYALLGYIISLIEKAPLAQLVATRIFKPLNMQHTTYAIQEVKTPIVTGIDDKGIFCHHWDGGICNGSLGIISTIEDMARFAISMCDTSNIAATVQATETFVINELVKANPGWNELLILPENIHMQGINGGTGGFGASVLLNRNQQCAVVLLTNCWPWHYLERIYPLGKALLVELSQ